jgi:aminopeptidase
MYGCRLQILVAKRLFPYAWLISLTAHLTVWVFSKARFSEALTGLRLWRGVGIPIPAASSAGSTNLDSWVVCGANMTDPRYKKLATLLVQYSTALKKGDRVLLDLIDVPDEFGIELIRAARAAGATPIVEARHTRLNREMLRGLNEENAALWRDLELFRMKKMQAYIAIRGSANASENADVASERMAMYSRFTRPVLNYRVNKTRWCVLRWPTPSMAQAAGMSTEAFENLYFDVCTMDYKRMERAMAPLQQRMKKADRVQIKGPGTDLNFSIKGIGAKMCKGDRNIPDGEVFSCPVKTSINGQIQFNAPTLYAGTKFENVLLEFKEGKIVKATSNNTRRLNEILDTDPGARYTGEFSLGFNPYILNPMCDILFDEKIAGSLHLTPGQAYEDCDNGNRSAVHWDMVLIQRPEWGGGSIWFDGELIRKDGTFMPKDLKGLNPANLK